MKKVEIASPELRFCTGGFKTRPLPLSFRVASQYKEAGGLNKLF
jgi:hypothetical protein